MRRGYAEGGRRGRGASRQIHQLGAQEGDGRRSRGDAEAVRRWRDLFREMHQVGNSVGDGWSRCGDALHGFLSGDTPTWCASKRWPEAAWAC